MKVKEMYQDRFIGAASFGDKPVTMTMDRAAREELHGPGGRKEMKWVLYFVEKSKFTGQQVQMVLVRTNAQAIAKMIAEDTDDWPGHKITLVREMVKLKGDMVPGIRVQGSPEITGPVEFEGEAIRNIPPRTLLPTRSVTSAAAEDLVPVPPITADDDEPVVWPGEE